MNTTSCLVGLVNLGNTCFLNSCIQVLQHTYELHKLVDEEVGNLPDIPDSVVIKEWNELRKVMQTQNGTVSPNRFVHMVQQVAHTKNRELFTGWAQNDITEFLLFLVECIHTSISKKIKIQINGKAENSTDQRAIHCYQLLQTIYSKEYSRVLDLFYGIYMTEILDSVTKEIVSIKPEHYFMLDLQILYNERVFSNLYECFESFTSPEMMMGDNAWFNEKRGAKEDVLRQVNFWNFPDVLVLTLKRFSPDGQRKIQTLVDFPLENLDLSRYVRGYKPESFIYDLFGVCNHMGGIMGGHYTSFVKNAAGQWIHYNDNMVEIVSNPSVIVSPKAYCLFYRKKNTLS